MSLSSAARDLLTTLMIVSSLLWEMMLWLSVSVIFKKNSCIRYSKRRKFRPKMHQNAFGGRALPGPAGGSLSAPPDPLAAIEGGCLLLRGEGNGKREGRGWQGEERKGKGRRERADPRPGLRKCKSGNPKVWGSDNYA